jgi:hypothetical protein
MAKKKKAASTNNGPVHRIRLSAISASIFANTSGEGGTFYNCQFDRAYLDGEDWKHTKSFGREDLLVLAKVADLAHSWIHAQQQGGNSSEEEPSPEPS